ncbi:MAG TPA: alpha/beta hydrolase [Cytophagales bacterium]|nr:alpha/beta hydrolase [Cytophagales bacterium]
MTLFQKSLGTALCLLSFFGPLAAQSPNYGNNPEAGHTLSLNGIELYFEVYGKGEPLFLLHGNGGSIASSAWKIEHFQEQYQVIVVDSRAHGNSTDDTSVPLTYRQMAEDIAVLMDRLELDSANIWGQSDGGILGLLLAIEHPEKVRRLATFGANIYPGKQAVFDEIDDWVTDSLTHLEPGHTQRLFGLMAYQPDISVTELQQIRCPVLIMTGDRDAIRLEHSLQIFYAIPQSNLFVMPGGTHGGSWQKPDLFNQVLGDFLAQPFSNLSTVEMIQQSAH